MKRLFQRHILRWYYRLRYKPQLHGPTYRVLYTYVTESGEAVAPIPPDPVKAMPQYLRIDVPVPLEATRVKVYIGSSVGDMKLVERTDNV